MRDGVVLLGGGEHTGWCHRILRELNIGAAKGVRGTRSSVGGTWLFLRFEPPFSPLPLRMLT